MTGIINNDDDTITVLTGSGTQFNTKKLILTTGPWTNKVLQYTGTELPLKVRGRDTQTVYVGSCQ